MKLKESYNRRKDKSILKQHAQKGRVGQNLRNFSILFRCTLFHFLQGMPETFFYIRERFPA